MKFEINGRHWTIREVDGDWLLEDYKKGRENSDTTFVFGVCKYTEQEILITKDMHWEAKVDTLKHELTHCWLHCNGVRYMDNFLEDDVCNIVASIHEFIDKVVLEYVKLEYAKVKRKEQKKKCLNKET